jgi:hypothetical protein
MTYSLRNATLLHACAENLLKYNNQQRSSSVDSRKMAAGAIFPLPRPRLSCSRQKADCHHPYEARGSTRSTLSIRSLVLTRQPSTLLAVALEPSDNMPRCRWQLR